MFEVGFYLQDSADTKNQWTNMLLEYEIKYLSIFFFRFAVQINWNKFWFRRLNFSRGEGKTTWTDDGGKKYWNLNFFNSQMASLPLSYVTELSLYISVGPQSSMHNSKALEIITNWIICISFYLQFVPAHI